MPIHSNVTCQTYSGPEVLFKTCVAMKFVDDDDDDGITGSLWHHFHKQQNLLSSCTSWWLCLLRKPTLSIMQAH